MAPNRKSPLSPRPHGLERHAQALGGPSREGGRDGQNARTEVLAKGPAPLPAAGLTAGLRWIWEAPGWPGYHWRPEALQGALEGLRAAQERLGLARDLLAPGMASEVILEVLKSEAVSTSEIEGLAINPSSVASSLARQLGLPGHAQVKRRPTEEALSSVLISVMRHPEEPLTKERLLEWHRSLFVERTLAPLKIGAFRTEEVFVASGQEGNLRIHFEGVPPQRVQGDMEAFLEWFNDSRGSMDGMVRAGLAHLWFVTIHPFEDGNGRLARAIADLAIEQDGRAAPGFLRMSRRILDCRNAYYQALMSAQRPEGLEATEWLTWFLAQATEAARGSERTVRMVIGKTVFWAIHREDDLNPRQRKVLARLLDAGPDGFEGGMTPKKYEAITGCSIPTASRDLADLARQKCLLVQGAGRGTRYEIPWREILREDPSTI